MNAAAWFVAVLALLLAGLWLAAGVVALTLAVARRQEARRMRRAYAAGVVAVTPRTVSSSSGFTSIDGSGNVRVVRKGE